MFDIGFSEILVIAVIALIVMGPERLPQALRTFALWFGRIRQQFRTVRSDLENEMGIDDIRRQLHNETILRDLDNAKEDIQNAGADIEKTMSSSEDDNMQPSPLPQEGQTPKAAKKTTPDDHQK
jgi:sec-independent protein translocase protein TatB